MVGEEGENASEKRESIECLRAYEVARHLGISRNTVIRMMREKKLPGFKVGNSWMTRRSDLEKHLAALAVAARESRKEAM